MRHLLFISALLFLTACQVSITPGESPHTLTAQEHIATADFDEVRVRNAFNIILIPSERYEVVIPENLRLPVGLDAKDIISVSDGTLMIAIPESFTGRNNFRINRRQPDIRVYFKSLNSLRLSGAADAKSEGTINAGKFQIRLSGASGVKLDIVAETITSEMSGASSLTLTGRANEHHITASGASNVKAEKLETRKSTIRISGASDAKITAEEVTGSASGASEVRINREAQHNISTRGSSSVRTL